jgi:hypothetical protein
MPEREMLRPELDGEYWMIGPNPDLGALQGATPDPTAPWGTTQECVDHHVFQSDDGAWHLWACIRYTAIGRLFYHWEAEQLTDENWRQTGEIMRADRSYGESLTDGFMDHEEEYMQSPFVIRHDGTFYLFYGTRKSRMDRHGNPVANSDPRMEGQICLMTSSDGRTWNRAKNSRGQSRIFLGPGATRDPCVLRLGDLWLMYYAGYHEQDNFRPGFYCRVSSDLQRWSEPTTVHFDISGRYGSGQFTCECPHVVERGGYYYLFRTQFYPDGVTHVFRSDNPFDFGVGDAADKYVGPIYAAAPEVIVDPADGKEYITSNHDLTGGTRLCRLRWVQDG